MCHDPWVVSDPDQCPGLFQSEDKSSESGARHVAGRLCIYAITATAHRSPVVDWNGEPWLGVCPGKVAWNGEAHPLDQLKERVAVVVGVDRRKVVRGDVIDEVARKLSWRRDGRGTEIAELHKSSGERLRHTRAGGRDIG